MKQLFSSAKQLYRSGNLPQARKRCLELLQEQPEHSDALHLLGVIALQTSRLREAHELIERAISFDNTVANYHVNLGEVYRQLERPEEALRCYRRALEIEPGHANAHNSLGVVLQARGDFDEAIAHYQSVLTTQPGDLSARENLRVAMRFREMLPSCRRSVDENPTSVMAHMNLSAVLNSAGRFNDAKGVVREMAGLAPLTMKCRQPQNELATVVQVFGLDNSRFVVGEDWKARLDAGHLDSSRIVSVDWFSSYFLHLCPGQSAMPELPEFDLFVNCIADPDLETATLAMAKELIGRYDRPVINNPDDVLRTARDSICRQVEDVPGLLAPKTIRVRLDGHWHPRHVLDAMEENQISFPIIVRPVGTHTGKGMEKIDGPEDLEARDLSRYEEIYVIEFSDFRSEDGLFRKARLLAVGGEFYPDHLYISKDWNIHRSNAVILMDTDQSLRDEEVAFLEDFRSYLSPQQCSAIQQLHEKLRLDFFGVDFALMPDDKLFVFEANAAMRLSFPEDETLRAYIASSVGRVIDALQELAMNRIESHPLVI